MKTFLSAVFFFLFCCFSCTDKEYIPSDEIDFSKPIVFRTGTGFMDNLDSLKYELEDYWDCGIANYTLPVLCSCACADVRKIPNVWSTCNNNISIASSYTGATTNNCDTLKSLYSSICLYTDFATFVDSAMSVVSEMNDNTGILTEAEYDLIDSTLNTLTTADSISFTPLRQAWYNLPNNSQLENAFSAIFIEMAYSLKYYESINSGPFLDDKDDIQAAFWKVVGAIAGAAGSVLYDCAADAIEHCDDGNFEFTTMEQVRDSAKKGFLLGLTR